MIKALILNLVLVAGILNSLFNNPIISVLLLLLIAALLSVVIWRFAALKTFLKNHVFLDEYIDTSEALPNHDYVVDLLKREITRDSTPRF